MASHGQDKATIGRRLRFGVFELERETLELFRRGRRLPLPPQPARALDLLLRRTGRLVSRDELRDHIWGEGTHVDFDSSLNRCIRQIRAALGDDAASARFLETLPRRGYRFLAAVEKVEPAAHAGGAAVDQATPQMPEKGRSLLPRWLLPAVPASLVVVAALASLGDRPQLLDKSSRPAALLTTTEDAREAYLRGTYHLDRYRSGLEPAPGEALRQLELAVELDPLLAPAYAELAWARLFERPATNELEQVRSLAELALELDEGQASAHRLLGRLAMYRDFDWPAAGRALDRAVELAPGDASSHHAKAFYLSALGLHDDAVAAIETALELDPSSVLVRGDVATIYYRARRFEAALGHFRLAVELQPDYLPALRGRLLTELARGRRAEAAEGARALMAAAGTDPVALTRLDAPDPGKALEAFWHWYLQRVGGYFESHPGKLSTADLALGHLALGQPVQALDALETAVQRRDSPLLAALAVDPAFDPLRRHPRFESLLEQLGLSGESAGR